MRPPRLAMERLCGLIEGNCIFEVKVPTTIYDPLRAEITAYEFKGMTGDCRGIKGKTIAKTHLYLTEFPKWDIPTQAILLEKSDEKRFEKEYKNFIKKIISK